VLLGGRFLVRWEMSGLHCLLFLPLLWRARANVLNQPLGNRTSAGECSTADVENGGTFFLPENQIKVEAHPFFDIIYAPTFKVVTSKPANESYVLVQCGQPHPTDAEVEAVAPLPAQWIRKNFTVPVRSYWAYRQKHYGYLNWLNVDDRAGVVISAVTEPCWQKAFACKPDLTVDAIFRSDLADKNDNVVQIPIDEEAQSYLHLAEYVKFFGALFNKDAQANQLYEQAKTAFEAAGSGHATRPVVAWIEHRGYEKKFYIHEGHWKKDMVQAAGGELFNGSTLQDLPGFTMSESGQSREIAISYSNGYTDQADASARLFAAMADVDVVVDQAWVLKPKDHTFAKFLEDYALTNESSNKFIQNRRVLRTDGTITNTSSQASDWDETPFARLDWAANGLARQIHGDSSKPYRYFRNLATGETPEVLDPSMCDAQLPKCGEGTPRVLPLLGDGKAPTPAPTPTDAPSDWTWAYVGAVTAILIILGLAVCVYISQNRVTLDKPQEDLATELAT